MCFLCKFSVTVQEKKNRGGHTRPGSELDVGGGLLVVQGAVGYLFIVFRMIKFCVHGPIRQSGLDG